MRDHFGFARIAAKEVIPALLGLLTKQDEDAGEDDYNISRAAYQCLQLFALAVGGEIMEVVLRFVDQNLEDSDWHKRDAAVSAFGAIMEGPDEKMLIPVIKQALPSLLKRMSDDVIQVQDSAAFALGRILEAGAITIDTNTQLPPLIEALFGGLASSPKMAGSCCWALMNLCDHFAGELGQATGPLSPHFQASVTALLSVTERYFHACLPTAFKQC